MLTIERRGWSVLQLEEVYRSLQKISKISKDATHGHIQGVIEGV